MKAEDAAEVIDQEHERDAFKRRAAIMIAFFAALLAVTGLGSNNAMKDALNENIQASNLYNWFQAKNIRQSGLELAADEVEHAWLANGSVPEAARAALTAKLAQYRKQIAEYESEPTTREGKKELLARAREHDAKRDRALKQDPYFDFAEALLQIAIVLMSVAIVADQRWLTWLAGGVGGLGALLMVNGYLLLVTLPGFG